MKSDFLDHFDDKLKNILKIKENGFKVEAIILIFSYFDYLAQFADKLHNDNFHNKANFRNFLMKYSDKNEILQYIQVDKFYNHCEIDSNIELKYKKYLDNISEDLIRVKKGKKLPITDFFDLNSVAPKDRKFFRKYTIVNRLYDFRNIAVHEYRNKFEKELDTNEPMVTYINRSGGNSSYYVMFPFEFLYELLINSYNNIRERYQQFIEEKWMLNR